MLANNDSRGGGGVMLAISPGAPLPTEGADTRPRSPANGAHGARGVLGAGGANAAPMIAKSCLPAAAPRPTVPSCSKPSTIVPHRVQTAPGHKGGGLTSRVDGNVPARFRLP